MQQFKKMTAENVKRNSQAAEVPAPDLDGA
jgi:hypothetical protein